MKNINGLLILAVVLFSNFAQAELITPVELTPTNSVFSATANQDTTYPAWTYPDDNDIWTFDLSAFNSEFLVTTELTLRDYCCHADDYNLYWDGVLLGNTGAGETGAFEFDITASIHTLEVEWLNPIDGGSWYNISISAVESSVPSAVPVPAALWLFGSGLLGLIGFAKSRK